MGIPLDAPEKDSDSKDGGIATGHNHLQADDEALNKLLEEVESLSDEEARKLLDE